MKDEKVAIGPRWYCKICSARYKTKFGMLIEVHHDSKAYFALTPPIDIDDIQAMHLKTVHDPSLVISPGRYIPIIYCACGATNEMSLDCVVRPKDPSSPEGFVVKDFLPYAADSMLRAAVAGDFHHSPADEAARYGVYKILAYEELSNLGLFEWGDLFKSAMIKGKKS